MSLQAPKSFFGGTFFGGEFFEHKEYGTWLPLIPSALKARTPDRSYIKRSRGRFQVLVTAEEIISLVAGRHLDNDDEQQMVDDLERELSRNFIKWEQRYAEDLLTERDRQFSERERGLPAWRKHTPENKRAEWLDRRRKALGRMN